MNTTKNTLPTLLGMCAGLFITVAGASVTVFDEDASVPNLTAPQIVDVPALEQAPVLLADADDDDGHERDDDDHSESESDDNEAPDHDGPDHDKDDDDDHEGPDDDKDNDDDDEPSRG